ncbi:helix-turn-helix domain-containing protein [Streptomyces sp. NPDC005385]|uniref:PucR family transcriptional regulator n=1 Tax=Streptomyces sp. NPDC005385 TaxID=3157039 RepID=UPI0033AB5A9B
MTAHLRFGPAGWIQQLAPSPAEAPPAPASSARTLAEASDGLGPRPVAWAVGVGDLLARVIVGEVPELGGGTEPFETLRMGTEAATLHALLLLADPSADRDIPEESLLGDREFARRRLGLDKMLRGIRVAHAALAQALMTACRQRAALSEQAEEFRRISESLFAFVDEFSSRMTSEYLDEHDRWLTSGAAAREETVRAILDGRPVREDHARELLGYRIEGHHLAVIARCASPAEGATGDLLRATADVLRRRGCATPLVLPTGRTTVWAWGEAQAPLPGQGLSEHAYPQGFRFAFGSVRQGLSGFRQSHEDARHAVRVMEVNPAGTGTGVDYPDIELPALLSTDLPSLRRFVSDELGALAADTPQAEQLRRTLRLYLRHERSLTVAAAELHVARNTVTYRVKRAQGLLGHDVASRLPEVMAALEAAWTLGPAVLRLAKDEVRETHLARPAARSR